MLPRSDLLDLAPAPLPNRRPDRYVGADGGIDLDELDAADHEALSRLYTAMEALYQRWRADPTPEGIRALASEIRGFGRPPLSELADTLGDRTREREDLRWSVRRAIHDLRGGALFALRLYGGLPVEELAGDPEILLASVFLARDQAKIVRNIVPGLDPEGRARDEAEKEHGISAVLEKWDGFRLPGRPPGSEVRVWSEYFGPLASCCLEASTVDRVLFNLLNNALRFGGAEPVHLQVLPIEGGALRWVVSNALSEDQSRWLDAEVGSDGAGVFRPGVTRGGEGTGLASCAEFISSAFGLGGADVALRDRYLGARWIAGRFDAWFHWPILDPGLEGGAEDRAGAGVAGGRER